MSKETKLMKNTAIIAIGNICTRCISFFMLPLYTSILSTQEYGNVDLVSTYATFLMIIMTLQFEQGVFRFLIDSRDCVQKQKKYITTSCISIIVVNFIFTICALPILLNINYEYTMYLLLWVMIGSVTSLILQIPRGLGNDTIYAIGSFISGASQIILNVLLVAVFHFGTNGMLFSSVISLVFTLIYIAIRLKLWKFINFKECDKKCFKELVKYSFPLIPYTLCWWVINASDRTIISIALGTAFNGIYAAAYKFPSLFSMITNIFQLSWTESASENVKDSDRDEYYQKIINKAIRFYSSCNIGIISVMPFIFDLIIKNDFTAAYLYIPILMTAALFHSISALYGSIYFAFKKTNKVAITTLLAAIINIVVNILFIKNIGLYAAAISSLLAYIVITIIRHIDVQKMIKIKVSGKYIFIESIMYLIVCYSYYTKIQILQICSFILILPYCIIQNKETLLSIINIGIKKLKLKGDNK